MIKTTYEIIGFPVYNIRSSSFALSVSRLSFTPLRIVIFLPDCITGSSIRFYIQRDSDDDVLDALGSGARMVRVITSVGCEC